jgi:hypothetical protein
MRQSDLIISLRVGPPVYVRWLLRLQAELISHHIGYFVGPINVLEAIVLLLDHLPRLLYWRLNLLNQLRLDRNLLLVASLLIHMIRHRLRSQGPCW